MSTVPLKGKSACLWHAYNALRDQGKGSVALGQLKVFTHNLAMSVGLSNDDCKALLATVGPSTELVDYMIFLSEALFSRISNVLPPPSPNNSRSQQQPAQFSLERIDEVCWMICSKSYHSKIIREQELYKLWRVFNALAEQSDTCTGNGCENEAAFPVAMDPEEVDLVVRRLAAILKTQYVASAQLANSNENIPFAQFVQIIEKNCLVGRDEHVTSAAFSELHDEIVANVLKKGYLLRLRGGLGVKGSGEQWWYVLTPNYLRFFTRRDEIDKRGELPLSEACRVENLSDKSKLAIAGIGIGTKMNRFAIHLADSYMAQKVVELSAQDVQTKSEWIQAIQQAIDWTGPSSSTHGAELSRRRAARAERKARQQADKDRRAADDERMAATLRQLDAEKKAREEAEAKMRTDEDRLQSELKAKEQARLLYEAERLAREEAECRCREEAKQRELEQQRIRELEDLQQKLESLLDEERQAKRDEEIVRNLQAKVLQDEFNKREELEIIKADLERMLVNEQSKSGVLEERRCQQEALYDKEMLRLASLEAERRQHDLEYEMAQEKLREAERAKAKLKVELEKRETDLRLHRGLAVRFNRAGQCSIDSSDDSSPFSPPAEIVSHRGRGAFVIPDCELRQAASTTSPDDFTSPLPSLSSAPKFSTSSTISSTSVNELESLSAPLSSPESSRNG